MTAGRPGSSGAAAASEGGSPGGRGRRLIPAYLATSGRERPRGTAGFDRLTLLVATDQPPPDIDFGPEHRRLWTLLRPGALTVVECAAHLGLPVSATVFLAADLVGGGHLLEQVALLLACAFDLGVMIARDTVDQPGTDRIHPIHVGQFDAFGRLIDRVQPLRQVADTRERQRS